MHGKANDCNYLSAAAVAPVSVASERITQGHRRSGVVGTSTRPRRGAEQSAARLVRGFVHAVVSRGPPRIHQVVPRVGVRSRKTRRRRVRVDGTDGRPGRRGGDARTRARLPGRRRRRYALDAYRWRSRDRRTEQHSLEKRGYARTHTPPGTEAALCVDRQTRARTRTRLTRRAARTRMVSPARHRRRRTVYVTGNYGNSHFRESAGRCALVPPDLLMFRGGGGGGGVRNAAARRPRAARPRTANLHAHKWIIIIITWNVRSQGCM